MPAILEVARRHGLRVIEDCAQSHGARIDRVSTGAFGDLGAFSFYPTKNLGAFGDGGLVATNNSRLCERLLALREYGWQKRYVSAVPGLNSRLDPLQAAVLGVKLTHLEADNDRRRAIAARYSAGLTGLGLELPTSAGVRHAFHQYVIRTPARDDLATFLASRSILTGIHYPVPVHLQPAYHDRRLSFDEPRETDRLCEEILSLPIFPQLTDAEVDRRAIAVRSCEWAARLRRPDVKGAAT